jgi:hypothetical protein
MRLLFVLLLAACGPPGTCANGTCSCPAAASCTLDCAAPPCQVACDSHSVCSGTCANGTCTCAANASCQFSCAAPPCHVVCGGNNPRCDGTCANGSCACAAGSHCRFTCASGPCHVDCPAGAACLVACPNAGVANTQDCDYTSCAAGAPTLCADGVTLACGTPCP